VRSGDPASPGLTWANIAKVPLCAQSITVRDEEVAGSNPVTPTLHSEHCARGFAARQCSVAFIADLVAHGLTRN
jgi:hypothetical protein